MTISNRIKKGYLICRLFSSKVLRSSFSFKCRTRLFMFISRNRMRDNESKSGFILRVKKTLVFSVCRPFTDLVLYSLSPGLKCEWDARNSYLSANRKSVSSCFEWFVDVDIDVTLSGCYSAALTRSLCSFNHRSFFLSLFWNDSRHLFTERQTVA